MKKILLIVCLVFLSVFFGCTNEKDLPSFSIDEYSYFLETFPSTMVLGEIQDSEDAKNKAEQAWVFLYGDHVLSQKPYHVFWDNINQVYLVKGTLHFYESGGVAHILIRADTGHVLAIWHEK